MSSGLRDIERELAPKRCGNCGWSVSNLSWVGQYCPHCKVRWGSWGEEKGEENRSRSSPTRVAHTASGRGPGAETRLESGFHAFIGAFCAVLLTGFVGNGKVPDSYLIPLLVFVFAAALLAFYSLYRWHNNNERRKYGLPPRP